MVWAWLGVAALNSLRLGFVASAAGTAVVATEYATDGALSKAAPGAIVTAYDSIKDSHPELAEQIKEHGFDALATFSDISDTQKAAAVNVIAGTLEEKGEHKLAVALKIGNVIAGTTLYAKIAAAEEGGKLDAIIDGITKDAGISTEDFETFLIDHKTEASFIENRFDVDLGERFPAYAATKEVTTAPDLNNLNIVETGRGALERGQEAIEASLTERFTRATINVALNILNAITFGLFSDFFDDLKAGNVVSQTAENHIPIQELGLDAPEPVI